MDLHCDCAESPAAEQPSGKINKTAFKLFGKRKSGSAMPTIFGVKSKGDGKSTVKMGMVRSKTLDGLADVVVLESNKKEEPCVESDADKQNTEINTKVVTIKADVSSVAKSHSFFSMLKKNGKSDNVRAENGEQKAGSRQKRGLKGLFNSMRWNKKDKNYKDEKEGSSENQPGLILSGSLTASLECIKEEIQKPLCETEKAGKDLPVDLPCEEPSGEVNASVEESNIKESAESPCSSHKTEKQPQEEDAPDSQHVENLCQLPDPVVETLQDTLDENITGCGDIIADQDDEGGNSAGPKIVPGNGKKATSKKNPSIVAYQGGGEEMASPEQVDDTDVQAFFSVIPQTEDSSEQLGKVSSPKQASREGKRTEGTCDSNAVKPTKLKQVAIPCPDKGDQKSKAREMRPCIRNSDEGYWDSTTPGQEEDTTKSVTKQALPRDSCSGDALYDLYTEPDENISRAHAEEQTLSCLPHSKPLSPLTTTCPVKTSSVNKESKIPISIKHLPVHPPTQGADTSINSSSSSTVGQHPPVKSELPRTKIPVSKVLVRRVSNKVITGTSGKIAYHDPAKK
ncbi:APC membrane recruitment protein 2 [Rhinophrynus dorsalis]